MIYNQHSDAEGAYVRLVDINGSEAKRLKLVEAIQNPDCGWFYRRNAGTFKQIPGTPKMCIRDRGCLGVVDDLLVHARSMAHLEHGHAATAVVHHLVGDLGEHACRQRGRAS